MKKTAVILALIILLSAVPVLSFADEVEISRYESSQLFLEQMNIAKETTSEGTLTRGEFINFVIKSMNFETDVIEDGSFSDVPPGHVYGNSIYLAKQMGIIGGAGDNNFYPEMKITYNSAIKVLVTALGYENIAKAKGGYPTGYMLIASDIDLNKGIALNALDEVSYENAVILIYNLLTSDMCEMSGISGDNAIVARAKGKSILTENYGYSKISGVLETSGFVSMEDGYSKKRSCISIEGKSFNTEIADAEKLLGLDVDCYYDENSGIAKAIYVKQSNRVEKIEAKEVLDYNNFQLTTENDNKTKSYTLDKGFTFVKNGRLLKASKNDFTSDKNGEFTLIDNNYDGRYDVVVLKSYFDMVVSGINKTEGSAYDSKSGKFVYLKTENGYSYKLSDSAGATMTVNDIENLHVLTVCESTDKKRIEAMVSKQSIFGTITEIGQDAIFVDGIEYETSEYFSKFNKSIVPGMSVTLLLSYDNRVITVLNESAGGMHYGYLIGYYKEQNSVSGKTMVAILNADGKVLETALSKRVMLDSIMMSADDNRVDNALQNQGFPRYQVVKFSLDEENNLNRIDTAEQIDKNQEFYDRYNREVFSYDSLGIYQKGVLAAYYPGRDVLAPFCALNGGEALFSVPKSFATDESAKLANYEYKYFGICESLNAGVYGSKTIDIYDLDKNLNPGAVVVYERTSANDTPEAIAKNIQPVMVDNVVDCIDENGETSKKITVLKNGTYVSHMLDENMKEYLVGDNLPKPGDIVKYITDTNGYISNLRIDAKYNANMKKVEKLISQSSQIDYAYFAGVVYTHSDGSFVIKRRLGPTFNLTTSNNPDDDLIAVKKNASTQYVLFDTKMGRARPVKESDIKDAVIFGEKNASEVVFNADYFYTNCIFIYE